MKDKFKFYLSRFKSYIDEYKQKFSALGKIKKSIIIAIPLLLICGTVLFILRDKPEQVHNFASEKFTYNSSNELQAYSKLFPSVGEDLLLEKMIVNLKQTENHLSAMGMFEIFLNLSSIESAQKIKEKEYILQDLMQRELESFSFEKLSTPQGKKVAKIILKNKANKELGKKLIKKLYFKTFVITP
jgi:flagellar basal body-associated protein FliL